MSRQSVGYYNGKENLSKGKKGIVKKLLRKNDEIDGNGVACYNEGRIFKTKNP